MGAIWSSYLMSFAMPTASARSLRPLYLDVNRISINPADGIVNLSVAADPVASFLNGFVF